MSSLNLVTDISAYGFKSKENKNVSFLVNSSRDNTETDVNTTGVAETVNYLGFSNSHQAAVYQLLMREVNNAG